MIPRRNVGDGRSIARGRYGRRSGESRAIPTGRLEAFSDGVFAIAITLLVLEIDVPLHAGADLGHELASQWPSYLAYVVSFMVIGIVWMNHHAVIDHLQGADRPLMALNLSCCCGSR